MNKSAEPSERGIANAAAEPDGEVEITPEMIEAGFAKLYEFDITHPMEGEMREAVRDVFLSMLRARPKSRSS